MKKVSIIFLSLFILIFVANAQSGAMRVVRISPQGDTSSENDYSAITVTFSEDIVPLGFNKNITNQYLSFNIPVNGKYRFIDSRTLAFYPESPLPKATKIDVTVNKGLKSLVSGNTLASDYKWTFNTKRPTFIKSSPYNNKTDIALRENIVLYFSDEMDLKSDISIYDEGDRKINTSIRYATTNDLRTWEIDQYSLKQVLVVVPREDYSKNTEIVLTGRNIKPLVGELGLSKDLRLSFTIHKDIAIISSDFQEVSADYQDNVPKIELTTTVKYSELIENMEISPEVVMPVFNEDEDSYDPSYRTFNLYNISFKPRNTYTITIKKGLKDIYGQELKEDFVMELVVNDYNPNFSMPSGLGVVEAYESKKLPMNVMNPKEINMYSKVLGKDDIIPYLFLNNQVYNDTAEAIYNRTKKNLLIYDNNAKLDLKFPINQYSIIPLYLDNYLGKAKFGLLSLKAETKIGYKLRDITNKAYIQVTEMGITGKFAGDSNTIFITELKTGKPLESVDVEIRDDFNKVLYKTKTDKEGIATTPGAFELGIVKSDTWDKPRQWAIASKGDDITFINSQMGNGVSPWRMNVDYQYENNYVSYQEDGEYQYVTTERNVKSYMFTERGIYKPGENVHIKGVVRDINKGKWEVAKDLGDIYYTITDSRGVEILKGTTKLNDYGSYFIDTTLLKTTPTGYYSVSATDKKTFSSYLNFRVDVFKALEFETRIWTEERDYVVGDNLNAKISGWYLFGEQMKKNGLRYNVSFSETTYTPPNNSGFRFTPLTWYEDDYYNAYYNNIISGNTNLDDKGEYSLITKVDVSRSIQAGNVTLEATVSGEDSQTVSSSRTILFHGADYYVGIRKAGYFIEANKPTTIQVVAVDYEGNRIAQKKVELEIIHRQWRSVKKAITGGRFQWESEKIDTVIDKATITTKNEPIDFTFTPEKTGLYFVNISSKDSKGRETKSSEYMYVIGSEYTPWAMFDDDLLEIITEKDSYEAGEIARIMVKNPYESATALVTVEREFVIDRFVTNIVGSSVLIEVPIKKEYLPNVYIGVALVKGRVEDKSYTNYGSDEGKPSFKIGYSSIAVSPKEKELDVKITKSHTEIEPGNTITVELDVKNKNNESVESEVMFSVVDIGVLNLINFKTPNWFSSFYGTRPLSVATSDSRIHIIGQRNYGEKGETPGGDSEAAKAMMRSANDMADEFSIRKNFLSTAFYKGNVLTDKNGKATITFDMPDNITSFRIMASAIDKNGNFGAGEDTITVKKNLMLMSTMPRFAILEDKFSAGATLYNYSSKDLEVSVIAVVSNATVKQDVKKIKIPKGENADVRFDIEANKLGEVQCLILAKAEEYTDAIETKFDVKLPITTEVFALYTSTDSNSVNIPITLPSQKDIYKDSGELSLYIAPSAFSEARTSLTYLFEYPYGCLEQQLSKAFPIINSKRLIVDMGLVNKTEEELDNVVISIIKSMKDYQGDSGGFAYYTSKTWISPFVSIYATDFLIKAKKDGYSVDENVLKNALTYIDNFLENKTPKPQYYSDEYIDLSSYAYALSVLAEGGLALNQKNIASILNKVDSMPLYGRLYLLKAMYYSKYNQNDIEQVLNLILNSIKEDPNTAHYELESKYRNMSWLHSSSVRDTALALTTLIETGYSNDRLNEKVLRYLIQQKNKDKYLNTQENVSIFNAMNQYFKKYESVYPEFKAEFTLLGSSILEGSFNGRRENIISDTFGFYDIPLYRNNLKSSSITLDKEGSGRVYYGISMKYALKKPDIKKDNGISISRTIKTKDGKIVNLEKDNFIQGQDYIVEIKINNNFERSFIAVNSGIAGGLRIQNSSFSTTSSDISKIEEDNSYYFNQREIYEDRVLLFADYLPRGEYVYKYVVRAVTEGNYLLQATKAEEMYSPEVYGYDGQYRINIVSK